MGEKEYEGIRGCFLPVHGRPFSTIFLFLVRIERQEGQLEEARWQKEGTGRRIKELTLCCSSLSLQTNLCLPSHFIFHFCNLLVSHATLPAPQLHGGSMSGKNNLLLERMYVVDSGFTTYGKDHKVPYMKALCTQQPPSSAAHTFFLLSNS